MFRKLKVYELGRLSSEEFKTAPKVPIVLVLDNIRSQHNIGAAFRTADAFAVESIILCGICATPPNAEIHKSALGAEDTVLWRHAGDTVQVVSELKDLGYTILSAEQTENSTSLDTISVEKGKKYAIIFGNEVKGVQQEVVDLSDIVVEIPQLGTKHSLNVSVSIGIVVWEVFKKLSPLSCFK